jgi:hypothetical protein
MAISPECCSNLFLNLLFSRMNVLPSSNHQSNGTREHKEFMSCIEHGLRLLFVVLLLSIKVNDTSISQITLSLPGPLPAITSSIIDGTNMFTSLIFF